MQQFDPPQAGPASEIDFGVGPVDAVLADAFPDTRVTELTLYTTPDGSLVATAPGRAGAVRLEATEAGLTAQQVPEAPDEELDPVEQVDPAPASEQFAGLGDLTRARGD